MSSGTPTAARSSTWRTTTTTGRAGSAPCPRRQPARSARVSGDKSPSTSSVSAEPCPGRSWSFPRTTMRSSEVRASPIRAPGRAESSRREPQVEYEVDHRAGEFVFLTNRSGAEDFKIATAPTATPGAGALARPHPHRPGTAHPGIEVSRTIWSGSSARTACRHRRPTDGTRRRTLDRLRGGRLFAGPSSSLSTTPRSCASPIPR